MRAYSNGRDGTRSRRAGAREHGSLHGARRRSTSRSGVRDSRRTTLRDLAPLRRHRCPRRLRPRGGPRGAAGGGSRHCSLGARVARAVRSEGRRTRHRVATSVRRGVFPRAARSAAAGARKRQPRRAMPRERVRCRTRRCRRGDAVAAAPCDGAHVVARRRAAATVRCRRRRAPLRASGGRQPALPAGARRPLRRRAPGASCRSQARRGRQADRRSHARQCTTTLPRICTSHGGCCLRGAGAGTYLEKERCRSSSPANLEGGRPYDA